MYLCTCTDGVWLSLVQRWGLAPLTLEWRHVHNGWHTHSCTRSTRTGRSATVSARFMQRRFWSQSNKHAEKPLRDLTSAQGRTNMDGLGPCHHQISPVEFYNVRISYDAKQREVLRGWWKLKQTSRRLKETNLEGNETLGVLGSGGSGDILFCSKQGAKLSFTFSSTSLFMTCLASSGAALHGTICKASLQGFPRPLALISVLPSEQWETCITAARKTVQLLVADRVGRFASACGGWMPCYKTVDEGCKRPRDHNDRYDWR